MALFRRSKSLHEQHAAAHALGLNALSAFHSVADDLDAAASEHRLVADQAYAQSDVLNALGDSADEAAVSNERAAEAIRSLVA